MNQRAHYRITGVLALLVTLLSWPATIAEADAENGTIGATTPISVAIDSPADGAVMTSGSFEVRGTASIGEGLTPETAIIYVLDVSYSTQWGEGCGGDQNGDNQHSRILDCEIAAAKNLNGLAVDKGSVNDVGLAVFGTNAATADVSPVSGTQLITGPTTDADGTGGRDVEQVLNSTYSVWGDGAGVKLFTLRNVGEGYTNFGGGITSALAAAGHSNQPNKIVVFMSDGLANVGSRVSDVLPIGGNGVKFYTFAIGTGSSCTNNPAGLGTLQEIADRTGGACTFVEDATKLPDIVPTVLSSRLNSLEMSVDGGAPFSIDSSLITPALPQTGPANVAYSTMVTGLGSGSHTICVLANGVDGSNSGSVEDCHTITVNSPPVADAGGPYIVDEGVRRTLDEATASDPDGDALTYTWDLDDNGTFETPSQTPSFSAEDLDGPSGPYPVTVQACDPDGLCDTDAAEVHVANVAPTAEFQASTPVDEGSPILLSLDNAQDPSRADREAGFSYAFDCGEGFGSPSPDNTASCPTTDNGTLIVQAKVIDKDGGESSYQQQVTINNVAPSVGPIAAPLDPVAVGAPILTSADFTDPGTADTHVGTWDWGDGSPLQQATLNQGAGFGSASDNHIYSTPGIYTVKLTIRDDDGGFDTEQFQYVVVYDPDGGFVTGGGWIDSPAGSYRPDPSAIGRANFGFVSKYKNGATVPTGQTEFQFKAGNLNFHSSSYDWLVVSGARAQYKGTGTINGAGAYRFMLTVIDGAINGGGGVDKFRIRIWDNDSGTLVYDTHIESDDTSDTAEPTTPLQGGNIVIHK